MMNTDDHDLKVSAFFGGENDTAGGLTLRPFTAGSYLMCQRRGLTLFTGQGGQLEESDQMWQMMAFLYLHAAPMTEVILAAGNAERFREAVDAFAFTLPPEAFREGTRRITELCAQVGAATVTVEPKPTPAGAATETPPPNS